MSAEILRRAAALMRERAEAATAGPWEADKWTDWVYVQQSAGDYADVALDSDGRPEDAAHIASWHPDVALAVADWLDGEARRIEVTEAVGLRVWHQANVDRALAVARAYLSDLA